MLLVQAKIIKNHRLVQKNSWVQKTIDYEREQYLKRKEFENNFLLSDKSLKKCLDFRNEVDDLILDISKNYGGMYFTNEDDTLPIHSILEKNQDIKKEILPFATCINTKNMGTGESFYGYEDSHSLINNTLYGNYYHEILNSEQGLYNFDLDIRSDPSSYDYLFEIKTPLFSEYVLTFQTDSVDSYNNISKLISDNFRDNRDVSIEFSVIPVFRSDELVENNLFFFKEVALMGLPLVSLKNKSKVFDRTLSLFDKENFIDSFHIFKRAIHNNIKINSKNFYSYASGSYYEDFIKSCGVQENDIIKLYSILGGYEYRTDFESPLVTLENSLKYIIESIDISNIEEEVNMEREEYDRENSDDYDEDDEDDDDSINWGSRDSVMFHPNSFVFYVDRQANEEVIKDIEKVENSRSFHIHEGNIVLNGIERTSSHILYNGEPIIFSAGDNN